MAKHVFFKEEFDKLALNGAIGHPDGKPGYTYIRVSSDEQGEEGRSGLPRQIEHVHQIAYQNLIRIPWEMVFADDFSGFELERPELNRLRAEYRKEQRRAAVIVMEYLDRLSRNADWHQGFLLEEMEKRRIQPLFWKGFSSRIERMVMGVVSQDAMRLSLDRMADGNRKKAESGRITARKPAYGYKFVDQHGEESYEARKMTYYAIREDEAGTVRLIYRRIAAGDGLFQIADDLNEAHVPAPKKSRYWEPVILRQIVKSALYRGEFIAYRWKTEKEVVTDENGKVRLREKRRVELPESEWIRVPAPAIVDAALWQAANDMLQKNRMMASRNGKQKYLLTGLLKCAECGYGFAGKAQRTMHGKRLDTPWRSYYCTYRLARGRYVKDEPHCSQKSIAASTIEAAVWTAVCNAFLEPDVLIQALETLLFGEEYEQNEQQIAYLEAEIAGKAGEDEKLYKAYMAGVFDETEYRDRRRLVKAEGERLTAELNKLRSRRATREYFELQKARILGSAEYVRSLDAHAETPFEVKQKILKMLVSRIALNEREQWFRLEGILGGIYAIENIPASGISSAGVK